VGDKQNNKTVAKIGIKNNNTQKVRSRRALDALVFLDIYIYKSEA
jgi:hypothetical protein